MNKCLFSTYSLVKLMIHSSIFRTGSEGLKKRDKSSRIIPLTIYIFGDMGRANQTAHVLCRFYSLCNVRTIKHIYSYSP